MTEPLQLIPRSIVGLTPAEKGVWPVSMAIGPDGKKIVVSRYSDTTWDMWPYIPQENKADCHKVIHWTIRVGDSEYLTDPRHAALLESAKDFVWSLFVFPVEGRVRPKMITVQNLTKDALAFLLRWMVQQGIERFADLQGRTLDYVAAAKTGVSPKSVTKRLFLVEDLWRQRTKIADGLHRHPWPTESVADLSGESSMADRYKPKTPLIPEHVFKQLATFALDYVERRADHILTTRDKIATAGGNAKNIYVNRQSMNVATVVARAEGFELARQHSHELQLLKTACYIVIAMFSGIRASELASLGVGCISRHETADGLDARWLHGTIYKTGHKPKKWLVPAIVEVAVQVMERWSAPLRSRMETEERRLSEIGDSGPSVVKRLHKVRQQKDKLFLAADTKKGNTVNVMSNAANLLAKFCVRLNILGDDGQPWPLAPHQFRRTFAYNYARSVMGDLLYLQHHYDHRSIDMTLLYSDEGTDGYESDTELLEMIAQAKHDRQVEILTGVLDSDASLAAGEQWIGDWRRTIRTAKNKEELIENLSGTLSLTGTGHSWCAGSAKGTSCGSRCMFEPDMCTECNWAIISEEHLPVWHEIAKQQETILACDDIGEPGQALARRILVKAKQTIAKLEGQTL